MQLRSAHICDAEEVLSKPSLSWLKKDCLAVSRIGSASVCFSRKTVLPVYKIIHFDWLPVHYLLQLSGGVLLFNIILRQGSSCPSPAPYGARILTDMSH